MANESVGSLKKAIKEEKKPAFDRVPADTLILWKVSVFDVDSLQKLTDVEFANEVLLLPMDRLSKVFSDVPSTSVELSPLLSTPS